uniref:Uncharacterized protein n=1 Tax=Dichotomaria marginata TaxID=268567 RepID=A0A1G4NS39_9FLOR|nr:Hypothetical protein ycf37 [Dichotomaria marginata]SCW21478.1 Hypothetical protein ycf37 [Dichotomaria marginata]
MIPIIYLLTMSIILTSITIVLSKQVLNFHIRLQDLIAFIFIKLTNKKYMEKKQNKVKIYIHQYKWTSALYELDKELKEKTIHKNLQQINYSIGFILENTNYTNIANKYYKSINKQKHN